MHTNHIAEIRAVARIAALAGAMVGCPGKDGPTGPTGPEAGGGVPTGSTGAQAPEGCAFDDARAVGGLAMCLAAEMPAVPEGIHTPGSPETRFEVRIYLRNVSDAPVGIHDDVPMAHEVAWAIADGDGVAWTPTFLPPPMPVPPPERKGPDTEIPPGAVHLLGTITGISGFHRADQPDGPWWQVPPAGSYAFGVAGLGVGGVEGTFAPDPARIEVAPANEPVDGLRVVLSAEPAVTRFAESPESIAPVALTVSFENVSAAPLKLDTMEFVQGKLDLLVRGGSTARSERPPGSTPAQAMAPAVEIAPGDTWVAGEKAYFPGVIGNEEIRVTAPGWVQVQVRYENTWEGSWRGVARSNPVWVHVAP